jgi:aminoglycoside phosphotransferase (APT) family kinase protein
VNDHSFDELFARYETQFQPITSLASLGGGGGWSGAKLWRFRAPHGGLLLRAWPPHGPGREHIERVHHWLTLTTELGFVPVPIRDRAGQSLQEWSGTLWEITPWLVGAADSSRPPGVEHLRPAFTGLAAFHQCLAGEQVEAVSTGLRHRHEEIIRLIRGGFHSLEIAINRQNEVGLPYSTLALAWLALARNVAPVLLEPLGRQLNRVIRVQPTLRDARPEHFLFEGERLTGLVDFGAMGVESVAADLARLSGEWLDGDLAGRREALASYERVRPLDPAEARLIDVFETTTALLIGERWIRWHYVENRNFDDPQAVLNGLKRGLMRLDRLVRVLSGSRASL